MDFMPMVWIQKEFKGVESNECEGVVRRFRVWRWLSRWSHTLTRVHTTMSPTWPLPIVHLPPVLWTLTWLARSLCLSPGPCLLRSAHKHALLSLVFGKNKLRTFWVPMCLLASSHLLLPIHSWTGERGESLPPSWPSLPLSPVDLLMLSHPSHFPEPSTVHSE